MSSFPKYRCDDCDELVQIIATGKRHADGFSSEYQRIIEHKDPRTKQFCRGSGRLV